MGVERYRKKPVVIEAIQIDSDDYDGMCEIVAWCSGKAIDFEGSVIAIDTLEGRMYADPGDWIIKGIQGEFYPCKPDIFAASYEPADSPTTGITREQVMEALRQPLAAPDASTTERGWAADAVMELLTKDTTDV